MRLTRGAVMDAKMHINLSVVSDGSEAKALSFREQHMAAHSDLNLSKKDGRDGLKETKESDTKKSIEVILLTITRPLDLTKAPPSKLDPAR